METNGTAGRVSVIIPSYQPDEKLMTVVTGLEELGFDDIIIVNDGSDEAHRKPFEEARTHGTVTVLEHEVNRGKGAALRTAFDYCLKNRPERSGVVTADGDAQHRPSDILACAGMMEQNPGKLVLGVRDFSLPHVPKKSRMGNRITSAVFLLLCGLKISDTQTGLRAIPMSMLPEMLTVTGDRYEYETNMLLAMKTFGIKHAECRIETVYIDGNQTSHFRPVRDSLRIYGLILKFVASSLTSTLIDLISFYLLTKFLDPLLNTGFDTIICTAIARAISSTCNFVINRNVVFKSDIPVRKTLTRYYALAIPIMLVSGGAVTLLKKAFGTTAPSLVTLLKMVVDTILYFVSFRVQREWVFNGRTFSKRKKQKKESADNE